MAKSWYSGKSRSNQTTIFTVTRDSTPEQQLPNPSSSPPLPSHTKKHEIQQNTTFQFEKKSEAKLASPNTTGKLSRRLKTSSSCSITKMEVSSPCQWLYNCSRCRSLVQPVLAGFVKGIGERKLYNVVKESRRRNQRDVTGHQQKFQLFERG